MSTHAQTEARQIRGRLKHPIIDADGHWAEFNPLMRQEFRRIGGDTAVEALDMASARIPNSLNMSVAERRRRRIGQEAFWFLPTKNTLDRATAMMPPLLYERLDDLGLDFCRSEEHTSELQSHSDLVCRLLLEKKKQRNRPSRHLSAQQDLQQHSA